MKKINLLFLALCLVTTSLFSFEKKEGDVILEKFNPPDTYWEVPEGSCGEACLWSVSQFFKINISQKEINAIVNPPNRGIHSGEILKILKKLKIPFTNISSTVSDPNFFLKDKIIKNIKAGNPVLLGVKIYPDENPKWVCDHFILVVGFNKETKELIFNSNEERDRITQSKLLNKKDGYSILHKSKYIYAIQINTGG
jgi:ABC-type bacteriocin/lantibiotic exporter with double-glycine peptidase domain